MFDYINPIMYNTDINSLAFAYNTGFACGINPNIGSANFFDGSIFNPVNIFNGWNLNTNIYTMNPWSGSTYGNFGFNNLYSEISGIYQQPPMYNYGNFNIYQLDNYPAETIYQSNPIYTPQIKNETSNKKAETKKIQPEPAKVTTTTPIKNTSAFLGTNFAINAQKYLGYNEADGSYRKFSNSREWCADFVSYVVDETYKSKGLKTPKGFKNHRVEDIKNWGINNNKFLSLADKSNKGKIIAENVKVGDILILRENGASHTGIVSKVNNDGTFETIEGNRSDKVGKATYSPNYHEISGFVQLA